jgi:hypothetical protein
MEYILISTAVAGIALFVAFFLHSTREAREEYQGTGGAKPELDDFWSDSMRSASSAVAGIFSSEDEQFIISEADEQVSALFRRERKRLALRWIERQKREAAGIMGRHRDASRRAADLQPASEVKLFLRYVRLKVTFEFLAVSVWLIGPQRLRGLAEEANAVFHGMQNPKTLGGEN